MPVAGDTSKTGPLVQTWVINIKYIKIQYVYAINKPRSHNRRDAGNSETCISCDVLCAVKHFDGSDAIYLLDKESLDSIMVS
jgi:hypothetical protein